MTSTEVELHEGANGRREWIALLEPAAALAQQVAATGFVPSAMRGNPAAIVAAILYGDELGLGPMQSLAKIAVIEGKPTLYAEAQRALILAAGHELRVDEATSTKVTVSGRRSGSSDWSSVTWSLDDAKRAGLAGRQNWRAYPRQMLTARATAELARVLFADVIGGLAATEEIEDVDPLDLPIGATPAAASTTQKRRRRRTSSQVAGDEAHSPGADSATDATETRPAVELPPLPDESSESLTTPRPDQDPPAPDNLETGGGENVAGGAGEVGGESETTSPAETVPDDVASPADIPLEDDAPEEKLPTPKQVEAMNALVGRLRETEIELEDRTRTKVLSTDQLWASAARRRNVDVDVMIELLGGRDAAGELHWSPLRASLTRVEASNLIDTLTDRAKRWGVE